MLELFYQHGIHRSSAERDQINEASTVQNATARSSTSAALNEAGSDYDSCNHEAQAIQGVYQGFRNGLSMLEWLIECNLNF